MPNHITNRITSPSANTARAIAHCMSADGAVDFNRLIPMPAIMQSGNSSPALVARAKACLGIRDERSFIHAHDKLPKDYSDEDFEQFVTHMRAIRQHGSPSWHEWSIAHWGTKWNAYESKIDPGLSVQFQTAWSCPEPIMRALAVKVAGPWTWEYADEDIGSNCGTWACDAGGALEHADPVDPVRFACDITGRDYADYMSEASDV